MSYFITMGILYVMSIDIDPSRLWKICDGGLNMHNIWGKAVRFFVGIV